jgi:hypothetical protein
MATVAEHNQIIKMCFDGNKHLKHVLSNEEIRNMTIIENRFPLTKLPVCGSCERLAMWGKGGQGVCRHCGTITKNPITYSSYLASGYDVDQTGTTFRSVAHKSEMVKRDIILPDYGM